jgi:hypothetical protein
MESCRWCGAPISSKDVVCSRCGARLRRENATCRRCKREIRAGLVVCPHCGEDLARRRIPWKLFGSVGGIALAAVAVYLILTLVPLPFGLPFVAAVPTPTPTEVILPPTPTFTATPRPPTATSTATATFTPIITETATVTATATLTSTVAPAPLETSTPTPTETPEFAFGAPRLLGPADEADLPEDQINISYGTIIKLTWESVGALAGDQYYSVSVSFERRDGQTREVVNWVKETSFVVPQEWYDSLGADRGVYWNVTVVSGTPGTDDSSSLSPASETWVFRWG